MFRFSQHSKRIATSFFAFFTKHLWINKKFSMFGLMWHKFSLLVYICYYELETTKETESADKGVLN